MATAPVASLRERADKVVSGLAGPARSQQTVSVAGGGALPGVEIPSWGLSLPGDRRAALRAHRPRPVVARVHEGETVIDLRTVAPDDDPEVAEAIMSAAVGEGGGGGRESNPPSQDHHDHPL
jgi:L-seryl-tRNA(Ser) seleniumtransferase